ncbi:MAG: DUF4836 family protein [Bacteroidota bacterium]
MKKILCLFAIAIMVVSCGKKNPESAYIPKDAVGVMYMNLGSLAEKSSNIDFKNLSIGKMFEQNAPREVKKLMNETLTAENMNAAFRKDFILGFMTLDRMLPSGGLVIPIKDGAAFENMITPMIEKAPGIKKQEKVGKGEAFTVYSNREMAIGWNNETALVVVAREYADQDLIDMTNLEASENINATNYFKDFFDASKDMGMHISSTPMSTIADSFATGMLGLDIDSKNNNFTYYGSFEDDYMHAQMKMNLNPVIKSVIGYDSWLATDYDANLLNVIPENSAMVMKMSFDFPALYEHFKSLPDNEALPEKIRKELKRGIERADGQSKGAAGMTPEEVFGIFGGSMVMGVTEGKVVKDSIRDYYSDDVEYRVFESKVPNVYAAVAIKDMEKFEKLMGLGMMFLRPEEKGKNYYQMYGDNFMILKDNMLYFTNDESKADEVANNGKLAANLSNFKHKSKLDSSIYIYSSPNASSVMGDFLSSMNPYENLYKTGDTKSSYELMSDYFGESHLTIGTDGMESFTYMKGEGNSLERMIMYMNANIEEMMKMMAQFR